MAKKEVDLPLNKQVKRVKMYGTKNSIHHAVGEETLVDPSMVSHFEARGLSQTPPPDEEEDEVKEEGVDKGADKA